MRLLIVKTLRIREKVQNGGGGGACQREERRERKEMGWERKRG